MPASSQVCIFPLKYGINMMSIFVYGLYLGCFRWFSNGTGILFLILKNLKSLLHYEVFLGFHYFVQSYLYFLVLECLILLHDLPFLSNKIVNFLQTRNMHWFLTCLYLLIYCFHLYCISCNLFS